MSLLGTSCATCRALRRSLLAFALGGLVAWQASGHMPVQAGNGPVMSGLMAVVVIFAFLNVFLRMREMRARFRKRG
jgi:hypothetical protein